MHAHILPIPAEGRGMSTLAEELDEIRRAEAKLCKQLDELARKKTLLLARLAIARMRQELNK